jgi:hypothetical protein
VRGAVARLGDEAGGDGGQRNSSGRQSDDLRGDTAPAVLRSVCPWGAQRAADPPAALPRRGCLVEVEVVELVDVVQLVEVKAIEVELVEVEQVFGPSGVC